jgi:cbb3-type cytochrome oxidase subunit 3
VTDWLSSWGTLLLTAVLVAVTAWYAYLTLTLAKSSREAAHSSRLAAEASLRALDIARAGVAVEFRVTPHYRSQRVCDADGQDSGDFDMHLAGIDVHGHGDTLFVHWCELMSVGTSEGDGVTLGVMYGTRLEPDTGHPVRLHRGESERFVIEDDALAIEGMVSHLAVKIWYSLTREDSVTGYWVEWSGQPGRDL